MMKIPEEKQLKEQRCKRCNRMLFKGDFNGTIESKCNKCKEINVINE
jgi:phage FluMu protein Com